MEPEEERQVHRYTPPRRPPPSLGHSSAVSTASSASGISRFSSSRSAAITPATSAGALSPGSNIALDDNGTPDPVSKEAASYIHPHSNSPESMGSASQASSRTFPTYVLGLLTALEADPAGTSASLHQATSQPPSAFSSASSGSNSALDRPAETDAIYASIARLADRLAKAEAGHQTVTTANQAAPNPSSQQQPFPSSSLQNGNKAAPNGAAATKPRPSSTASPFAPAVLMDLVNGGPPKLPPEEGARSTAEEELGQLKDQVKDFARVYVSSLPFSRFTVMVQDSDCNLD